MHECALQRSPIKNRVDAWIMVLNHDLELPWKREVHHGEA